MAKAINFEYTTKQRLKIDTKLLRSTLEQVRDQLLRHDINGGGRKLSMNTVCNVTTQGKSCGMAACIGGWASIFLLGFEGDKDDERRYQVENLFGALIRLGGDRLNNLFYNYDRTADYDEPKIAATAIQRYLDGKDPWPKGEMPDVLPYKRRRALTARR